MAEEIVIVGCGPGGEAYLLPAGRRAIDDAEVVAGPPHLLAAFASGKALQIPSSGSGDAMIEQLTSHVGRKRIAVLVTGDPGLFSLARKVMACFGRDACRVIPGISSVQTAFARIGVDWEDACIISAHAKSPITDGSAYKDRRKIAVLAGGGGSRSWLCSLGSTLSQSHDIFVCSNLTCPEESVRRVAAADLGNTVLPSRSVILFIHKECLW